MLPPPPTLSGTARRPLQVLLIDDNLADLLLAREAFAALGEQVGLTSYRSGGAALQALGQANAALPDVVLLDVNMPGLNGFEVLSTLKSDARLRPIPVVMLTTSGSREDVREAYARRANAYLLKSGDFGEFCADIRGFVQFWAGSELPH
ncbi:receiver domain REC [Deinococcus aerius]|uniref:Receiver domain REC n=1 Tax=Deinococcus aerius TaxID=200253 RepID=A0A2I9CW61_9DEIO|nr:response regulator [Deinococcus aerius]GBF06229.1 receiver domain REC [Deinococcus aerius]